MRGVRPRLLERFDRRVDRGGRGALLVSLTANCEEILNAAAGAALAAPALGMPSRNELVLLCPEEVTRVREQVEENLRRFEPRFEPVGIDVVEQADAGEPCQLFVVRGRLADGDREALRLLLRIGQQGRFTVRVME